MGKSVLILANSDSGLYDFRREVIIALQKEGYRGMTPLYDGSSIAGYRLREKDRRPGLCPV